MPPGFLCSAASVSAYQAPLFGLQKTRLRQSTRAASASRAGLTVFLCHASRWLTESRKSRKESTSTYGLAAVITSILIRAALSTLSQEILQQQIMLVG